jgi:maltose alpha-D-glucosyltransferase/alpha-amylase
MSTVPRWLDEAVLYEIYPQSFADANGDGIGDLRGIIERLDYLAWLGVGALWLNPCFTSPMRDAGYDVSDYYSVAPRYGTNDDLAELAEAARDRGIRVLLDLVAGHTSDAHPWFLAARDDPADGRYIFADPSQVVAGRQGRRRPAGQGQDWRPSGGERRPGDAGEDRDTTGRSGRSPGPQWVPSPGRRPGWYLPNFFSFQPALNFGYARPNPAEPWRQRVDAPGPRANRAELRSVIAYWLDLGVAGFRVDLASTLVKDDPGWHETARLWREIRGWLDAAHPGAVLMSEWNSPAVAIPAGFHADFYLAIGPEHRSLFDNGAGLVSAQPENSGDAGEGAVQPTASCYFSAAGSGSPEAFLAAWRRDVAATGTSGRIALFSSDHDFNRPVCGERTADQLGPVFAFLLTWPAVPGIHCGDEIGMRFVPGLPDTEGSRIWPGWNRAGSRTPVQWDDGPNAGFSAAPASALYLPVDPDPGRPTVSAQRASDGSLLHQVRRLIALRKQVPALRTGGGVDVLHAGYPLVYLRGGTHLVVINPRREPATVALPSATARAVPVIEAGVRLRAGEITADGFSYGVFEV